MNIFLLKNNFLEFHNLYKFEKNDSFIYLIEKSSNKKIGRLYLTSVYLKSFSNKKYRLDGLIPFIESLCRLKEKVPEKDMKMLYGDEFYDSVLTCNKIFEILNNIEISKSKSSLSNNNLLSSINYVLTPCKNENNNIVFKVILKYKGKQWTTYLHSFKRIDWDLISILSYLFRNSYIGLDSYRDFCNSENGRNWESEDLRLKTWENCVTARKNLERLFGSDIEKIDRERQRIISED